MSTRYAFLLDDVEKFELNHGLSFSIDRSQIREREGQEVVNLTLKQLDSMVSLILQTEKEQEYLHAGIQRFQPFSISMFVFNDAVWRLMNKKEESPDTMLPMITIPCFYWDKEAISHNNPHGIRRDHHQEFRLKLEPRKQLSLFGDGGDFCGIVDSQLADRRRSARSLLMPNLPEQKKLVPKYAYQDIGLFIKLGNIEKEIYPQPQREIDYTYSAHPQIFYEHGFSLITDGSNVELKIGRKRPQKMFGKTLILFGKEWGTESSRQEILEYHVWLAHMYQLL